MSMSMSEPHLHSSAAPPKSQDEKERKGREPCFCPSLPVFPLGNASFSYPKARGERSGRGSRAQLIRHTTETRGAGRGWKTKKTKKKKRGSHRSASLLDEPISSTPSTRASISHRPWKSGRVEDEICLFRISSVRRPSVNASSPCPPKGCHHTYMYVHLIR